MWLVACKMGRAVANKSYAFCIPYGNSFTLLANTSAVNYLISEHIYRDSFTSEWNYSTFSVKKISKKAIFELQLCWCLYAQVCDIKHLALLGVDHHISVLSGHVIQDELKTILIHICHVYFKTSTASINTRHFETQIHTNEYNLIF